MYNVNLKNYRKKMGIGLPFLLIGILVLISILSFLFSGTIKKLKTDASVDATRIDSNYHIDSDNSRMYSPIYYYEVNGIEYSCPTPYSSNSTVKTNQTKVYYNSKDPKQCVNEYQANPDPLMYIFLILPAAFIFIGIKLTKPNIEQMKKIKNLSQNGILIQGLPYKMVPSNISVNNVRLQAIEVEYTSPSGETVYLVGEPRFDRKMKDADEKVDLLIDPSDINNYYIDFNITRKD